MKAMYIIISFMVNEINDTILFDGICNLCNGFVQFIIKKGKKNRFSFVALQSLKGKAILEANGLTDYYNSSLVYVCTKGVLIQSDAALNILKDMGYPWRILYVAIIFPKFIRDGLYQIVARNRYRLFGKNDQCEIPH